MRRPAAGVHGTLSGAVATATFTTTAPAGRPPSISSAGSTLASRSQVSSGRRTLVTPGTGSGGGATIPSVPVQRPSSACSPAAIPDLPAASAGDVVAGPRLVEERLRQPVGRQPGRARAPALQRRAGQGRGGHRAVGRQPDRERGRLRGAPERRQPRILRRARSAEDARRGRLRCRR